MLPIHDASVREPCLPAPHKAVGRIYVVTWLQILRPEGDDYGKLRAVGAGGRFRCVLVRIG